MQRLLSGLQCSTTGRLWQEIRDRNINRSMNLFPLLSFCQHGLAVVHFSSLQPQLLSKLYFLRVQLTAPLSCHFMHRNDNIFSFLLAYVSGWFLYSCSHLYNSPLLKLFRYPFGQGICRPPGTPIDILHLEKQKQ